MHIAALGAAADSGPNTLAKWFASNRAYQHICAGVILPRTCAKSAPTTPALRRFLFFWARIPVDCSADVGMYVQAR